MGSVTAGLGYSSASIAVLGYRWENPIWSMLKKLVRQNWMNSLLVCPVLFAFMYCIYLSQLQSSSSMCICVFTCYMCFHIGSGVRVAVVSPEIRGFLCSCFLCSISRSMLGKLTILFKAWKDEHRKTMLSLPLFKVTALLSLATQLNCLSLSKKKGPHRSGGLFSHNIMRLVGVFCFFEEGLVS